MKRNNISRRAVLSSIGAAGVAGLAGCAGDDGESAEVEAAFVYAHEASGLGYTQAHDNGRQLINDEFDWLETSYTEEVGAEDTARAVEQYARRDADIIYATNFDHMDGMFEVAEEYPDTRFEHCSGFLQRENMGRYFARLYEARYLTGIAAGQLTETDTLGYVASVPIAEVVRQLNAFYLGAASVNPDVSMNVRWLNTFNDPPSASDAADALADDGADVINNHMSTAAAVSAARSNDAWSFTYTTSMSEDGGDLYGGSALFNWGEYYRQSIESVRDGSWEASAYWEGLDDGVVDVELGDAVSDSIVADVETAREDLISGEIDIWEDTEFEGADDEFLFGEMESYVDGIEGEVPG